MKKGVAYLNVTSFHRLKSETKRLKKNCEVIAKTQGSSSSSISKYDRMFLNWVHRLLNKTNEYWFIFSLFCHDIVVTSHVNLT